MRTAWGAGGRVAAVVTMVLVCAALSPPASVAAETYTISGSVSGEVAGPVGGVVVEALTYDDEAEGYEDLAGSTTTLADGTFELDLPPDRYALLFKGPRVAWWEFWEDDDWFPSSIDLTNGSVDGIDATVSLNPVILGTVTDQDGAPVEDVDVRAGTCGIDPGYFEPPLNGPLPTYCIVSRTDSEGRYEVVLDRQARSDIIVGFAVDDARMARSYDPDRPTPATAERFDPADDTVTTVDATLRPGARISGSVTGRGATVPGYTVAALQRVDDELVEIKKATVVRPGGGGFALTGLRAGTYRLLYRPRTAGPRLGMVLSPPFAVGDGARVARPGVTLRPVQPKAYGARRSGSFLTAAPPAWTVVWPACTGGCPSGQPDVSWLRDGRLILDQTPSYRLTRADVGRRITAVLTYIRRGLPGVVLRRDVGTIRR